MIGKVFNNFLKLLENKYIGTMVSLFLVLFGGLAAPEIPDFIKNILNNDLFRLVYVFLLTYIAENNIQIALVVAVVFLVLNGLVANAAVKEAFGEAVKDVESNDERIVRLYEESGDAEAKAVKAEQASSENAEELRKIANEAKKAAEDASKEQADSEDTDDIIGDLDWDPDDP